MKSGDDRRFLEEAVRLAVENVRAARGGPFGAVVVRGGEVIGRGANRVTAENDPTLHAEVVAIREAARAVGDFHLEGCDIYASCEPCPMCLGAIYWARLDRLFYASPSAEAAEIGFDDAFIYEELERSASDRRLVTRHVPLPDASRPFREWELQEDRIEY